MPAEFKDYLEKHGDVKIYTELKNSSGNSKVDISLLKSLIDQSFESRTSYEFIIVGSADKADILLKGDITEYIWSEIDPVDQVWGIGSAAIDAATAENYARLQAKMEIVAVETGRVIWSDKVQATVTRHVMPEDLSYELVYDRFVKSLKTILFKKDHASFNSR
jgi:hypothetical protein